MTEKRFETHLGGENVGCRGHKHTGWPQLSDGEPFRTFSDTNSPEQRLCNRIGPTALDILLSLQVIQNSNGDTQVICNQRKALSVLRRK